MNINIKNAEFNLSRETIELEVEVQDNFPSNKYRETLVDFVQSEELGEYMMDDFCYEDYGFHKDDEDKTNVKVAQNILWTYNAELVIQLEWIILRAIRDTDVNLPENKTASCKYDLENLQVQVTLIQPDQPLLTYPNYKGPK